MNNLLEELPGRIRTAVVFCIFPNVFPGLPCAAGSIFDLFPLLGRIVDAPESHHHSFPFLILLLLPISTGGWSSLLVPYAPFFSFLQLPVWSLQLRGCSRAEDIVATVILSVCSITIMGYYFDLYGDGLVSKIFSSKPSKRENGKRYAGLQPRPQTANVAKSLKR